MVFSKRSATDLLQCALSFREFEEKEERGKEVPSRFETEEDAISWMSDCLWKEANEAMRESIGDPVNPNLHAVDMETEEPGIVVVKGKKKEVQRRRKGEGKEEGGGMRKSPSSLYQRRKNTYEEEEGKRFDIPKDRTEEEAEKKCKEKQDLEKKRAKSERAREERKRKIEEETEEEKRERLEKAKEKREERKKKKEEEKRMEEKKKRMEEEEKDGGEEEREEEEREEEEKKEEENEEGETVPSLQEVMEEEEKGMAESYLMRGEEEEREKKEMRREGELTYYESPVPHDRHLRALCSSKLSKKLRGPILKGEKSESLIILYGPPGTGKTTSLLSLLEKRVGKKKRVFLCAPTNVGAANLYSRLGEEEKREASLILPESKIPSDCAVLSQDPGKRIVCGTVSGRSGPILDRERFDAVFLDEAAQCMEAWAWGLLREEVDLFCMAGDVQQLPALVSEEGRKRRHDRSLMERLVLEEKYPYDLLSVQRRMHDSIFQFCNDSFYSSSLTTEFGKGEEILSPPAGVIDVKEGKVEKAGTSFRNLEEASVCVQEAKSILSLNPSFSVVILSPYSSQVREIISLNPGVPVHTVDSFQGKEADVVILSVVKQVDMGFWNDHRRVVVSLTRARRGIRVVGKREDWRGHLSSLPWASLPRSPPPPKKKAASKKQKA